MEYRVLKEAELDAWFRHVETLFSLDSTTYFRDHYFFDPFATINGIFVCVDDGAIVSTVRVFHRKCYVENKEVTMGGIGEVSTQPAYRGQGIAAKLLQMSTEYMKEQNFDVSILSAGKQAAPLYAREGWKSLTMTMGTLKDLKGVPLDVDSKFTILIGGYCDLNSEQQKQLEDLYISNSSHLVGPTVRTSKYWVDWISHKTNTPYSAILIQKQNNEVKGYLSIRKNRERITAHKNITEMEKGDLTLADFYISSNEMDSSFPFLLAALNHYEPDRVPVDVHYYAASIVHSVFQGLESTDDGYMVKSIGPHFNIEPLLNAKNVLFWDSDAF